MPDRPDARLRQGWRELVHHRATAWVILVATFSLTVAAGWLTDGFMATRAEDRFGREAAQLRDSIALRLQVYEMMLRGGVGLFAASREVSRQEWRAYVARYEIDRLYPGVQGMGYSAVIAPGRLADHERAMRAEGLSGYRVHPAGEGGLRTAIVYLEPMTARNLRALGYDMFSEPVRRKAMARARDGGQAALSGRVTLVQESGRDVQSGFLMYLPVYRNGAAVATAGERRAALQGYVYSPFRAGDFMAGIGPAGLAFALYDGARAEPGRLIYEAGVPAAAARRDRFAATEAIHFAGHQWTLAARAGTGYMTALERALPWLIGAFGAVIDLLLFAVFIALYQRNVRSESQAAAMTLELRQGRNRLAAILDNMPFLAWLKDADGRFVAVNRPFARACGAAEPDDVVGKTDLDVWPTREALEYIADHEEVMRSGQGVCLEREFRDGDAPRWLELYKAPVFDADGRVVGSTGFSLDVTERRLAELEQERLQAQLRQALKLEALGRLTGGVAHGFNNILAAMLGYTHLAQRQLGQDSDSRLYQYIEQIRLAGERARDLVASMVAYTRMQPDHIANAIDPLPTVRETVKLLASAIPASIELRLGAEEPLPLVKIESADLEEILVKLVLNARDALGESGLIDIGLRVSEEIGRDCSICQKPVIGRYVMLEVQDNGPGIPADVLPRIFDPFFTTKAVGKGAGLGLSMVQGLIRKTGGHVVVHSRVGQGSVFQVLIPAAAG